MLYKAFSRYSSSFSPVWVNRWSTSKSFSSDLMTRSRVSSLLTFQDDFLLLVDESFVADLENSKEQLGVVHVELLDIAVNSHL